MRRLILAAVLLAPSPALAGKRYGSFMIDAVDKTAALGGPLGLFSSSKSWFERTETASGERIADFRDGDCRGTYDFAPKGALLHRARALSVLEGRFGRVYARLDVWYPPEPSRIAVNTAAGKRELPHREPELTVESSGPVESFALIRVLKADKKFKIATADYAREGTLAALRVDVSSGDWTASEVAFSSSPAAAAAWGLPASVDPKSFPAKPFESVAARGEDVEAEAALIYRARGTLVERVQRYGTLTERTWLSFPATEVERALTKTEAAFPFAAGPGL